jgi:hypothetical protein
MPGFGTIVPARLTGAQVGRTGSVSYLGTVTLIDRIGGDIRAAGRLLDRVRFGALDRTSFAIESVSRNPRRGVEPVRPTLIDIGSDTGLVERLDRLVGGALVVPAVPAAGPIRPAPIPVGAAA